LGDVVGFVAILPFLRAVFVADSSSKLVIYLQKSLGFDLRPPCSQASLILLSPHALYKGWHLISHKPVPVNNSTHIWLDASSCDNLSVMRLVVDDLFGVKSLLNNMSG